MSSVVLLYLNIYLGLSCFMSGLTWVNAFNFYFFLVCFLLTVIYTILFGFASVQDYKTTGPYEVGFKELYTKGTKQRYTAWYPVDRQVYERQYDPTDAVPLKNFEETKEYENGIF